jgi:hypothetical protein
MKSNNDLRLEAQEDLKFLESLACRGRVDEATAAAELARARGLVKNIWNLNHKDKLIRVLNDLERIRWILSGMDPAQWKWS